uniref:Putative ovule protein n=1 Tax=Solanum chacoense TaxID=4108 RepID=A0A0V0H5Y0_SOLCH
MLGRTSSGKSYVYFTSEDQKTCKMLSLWSRETYGDIYEDPKKLEAQMKVLEENSVMNNTKVNICEPSRCRAEFTKYLKLQDAILRQKARAKWLEEGDANTSYFHSTIKDRRRLSLKKIMNEQNQCLEGNDQIVEGAVSFYQNLFSRESLYRY